jgi:hypothetical protein
MSELLSMECGRAQGLMAQFVDGELGAEESEWLHEHLNGCAGCQRALGAFAEVDSELADWGRGVAWRNAAPLDARERLAGKMTAVRARRRAIGWIPAAAAAVAAAVVIAAMAPHRKPAPDMREERPFIEIPYLAPLDPHESATIVRMNIRIATLIAAGYRVSGDPAEIIAADVLVGEDGRVHAVRAPADIGLNGTGD